MARGGRRGPATVGHGRSGAVTGLCRGVVGLLRKQEVRTLMAVIALGAAQVQRLIVPIPVVSG